MFDVNTLVGKKLGKTRLKLANLGVTFEVIYPFQETKKGEKGSLLLITDGKKILKVEEYDESAS